MKKCLMLAGAMAEYDAIEDAATEVSSVTRAVASEGRSYTLNGTLASGSTRGVVIRNGEKVFRQKSCALFRPPLAPSNLGGEKVKAALECSLYFSV